MDIFNKNISILKKRNPYLAEHLLSVRIPDEYIVLYAKNGQPVLKAGNITFHSLYDPGKEARGIVTALEKKLSINRESLVVVYGLGFGYHVQALLDKKIPAVIMEPDVSILRCAMEHVDLSDILETTDIYVSCHDNFPCISHAVIWGYPPSVKHNRKTFDTLKRYNNGEHTNTGLSAQRQRKKLKIMVVSPIYGGSLPVAGYCCRALKKLGHDAELWDASIFDKPFHKVLNLNLDKANKKILYDLFLHLISEMIVASCGDARPDMILALAQAPLSIEALQRFKETGITTAFWFVEDYSYIDYWRAYAPHYDFYFTIQEDDFFTELKKIGVRNYYYLPMAADPEIHMPLNLLPEEINRYGSDLSFMGAGYYNRQKFFCGLLDQDFKIWGTEWDPRSPVWKAVQQGGERIATEETVKIFNAARININLHSSACHEGIHPDGNFINPRTYEISSCGGFQMVDYRRILEKHFVIGEEIICYSSLEELRSLAAYYLQHSDKRASIAQRGRARVIKSHTYEQRMNEMLSFIMERQPECFNDKANSNCAVRDIESFCEKHPEVKPILDEVTAKGWRTDIDHIAASIQSKDGTLQYPEAVFLLLKEYQALVREFTR